MLSLVNCKITGVWGYGPAVLSSSGVNSQRAVTLVLPPSLSQALCIILAY